jgi:DNA mismatch repair protein MutL
MNTLDVIKLLPDSIANKIAAGEVIQRPSSVVKELLENAIDAKATKIQLIIKEAGKILIQVIDNGKGMSVTDARLCFERHATSKLSSADDLFNISTKGFRGEALPSIASVSQVELKTKRENDSIATIIEINGGDFQTQTSGTHPVGTSVLVKNLFYNIPARRKFLKSNNVEYSHILDEFNRVAIAHYDIEFSLVHNDKEIILLTSGSLASRLVGLFGKNYKSALVQVNEETSLATFTGYIVKPEFSKKIRGDQFFFVNKRFIKSSNLHFAVSSTYSQLIPKDAYAGYFIFIETDPQSIDINIHPTKTEIKFEDERSVFSLLKSVVKTSLGKFNITPSIDFETTNSIEFPVLNTNSFVTAPSIKIDQSYNPFSNNELKNLHKFNNFEKENFQIDTSEIEATQLLYKNIEKESENFEIETPQTEIITSAFAQNSTKSSDENSEFKAFQFTDKYIVTKIKSGIVVINQQYAAERILYEKNIKNFALHSTDSQQLLFPVTIELDLKQYELMIHLQEDLKILGFEFESFGKNSLLFRGFPSYIVEADLKNTIELFAENINNEQSINNIQRSSTICKIISTISSKKWIKPLLPKEIDAMVNELFSCEQPFLTPSGKATLVNFTLTDISSKF